MQDTGAEEAWSRIAGLLRGRVGEDTYKRWFSNMVLVRDTGTHLELAVEDEICMAWIETNYAPVIQDAALEILDGPRQLTFVLQGRDSGQALAAPAALSPWEEKAGRLPASPSRTRTAQASRSRRQDRAANLNPNYSFGNFVVGSNNEFAHAAACAMASADISPFNPLFIHGGPGLGKTHLMQAIGNEIARQRDAQSVLYMTSEQFTNEYIEAIQTRTIPKFHRKYRKVDVLLLDDVQFFSGRDKTQEEFFHTFNTLFDGHKHIVLSSDRPACEIARLEPRLVSRFESGLTVDIQAPGFETRMAILQQKRKQWGVKVDDEILQFLAERISKNVRRLEGALMRVATFASLSGGTLDIPRAETLLRDILREENTRQVSIDDIQRHVAGHFDLKLADMSSRRRPASIAFPRQIAMYLSRRMTTSSLQDIGEAFGGRDHGTVIHANKVIEARIGSDSSLRDLIERLEGGLR